MALLTDDELFGAAPAAQPSLLTDEDLFAGAPAQPTPEVGLGERFLLNVREGFKNNLLGSEIERQKSGAADLSAASVFDTQAADLADAQQRLSAMAPDDPRRKLVELDPAFGATGRFGQDGTYLQTPQDIQGEAAATRAVGEQKREQYLAERLPEMQAYENTPNWYEEDSLLGKVAAGGSALAGQLVGGAASPESLVPVTRAATIPMTFVKGAAVNAGVNAAVDPLVQQNQIESGTRDQYSLADTAISAALGGVIGGGINVAPELIAGARRLLSGRRGVAPEAITPEDVATLSKDDIEALVREQTVQPTLSPTETIAAATGMNTPEQLPARSPERRQAQRELADVFNQPEVQRRGAFDDMGELVSRGESVVRDGTGTAVSADRLAALRNARSTAERAGVQLDNEQLQVAANYIERGVNPVEVMNTFRRAARSTEIRDVPLARQEQIDTNTRKLAEDAFRLADIRRQRREADMAAGAEPRPDYQAGALDDATYSPRLEQDLAARSKAPPKGVNIDQPGAPRSAVDRITSSSLAPRVLDGETLPPEVPVRGAAAELDRPVIDGETVAPQTQRRLEQPRPAQSDLDRALAMSEDDYIRSINPEGKVISEDDKILLSIGDIEAPPSAAPAGQFKARDGADIQVVRDADGAMYAKRGDEVLGEMRTYEDGETVINVVQEAQGQGVGRGLAAAYIRENPFAQSGGFSPAGEANRRSAFRQLQAERAGQQVDTLQPVGDTARPSVQTEAVPNEQPLRPERPVAGAGGNRVQDRSGETGLGADARMERPAAGREEAAPAVAEPAIQREGDLNADNPRADSRAAVAGSDDSPTGRRSAPQDESPARTSGQYEDLDAKLDAAFDREPTPGNPVDSRLDSDTAAKAEAFLESTRWDERGGKLLRDENGNATGRTQWMSTDPEVQRVLTDNKISADAARQLVKRALSGQGKPLTDKQQGVVQALMDIVEDRSWGGADRKWTPDDEPVLSSYSEIDLSARDAETRKANQAVQASRRAEESRAQADRDRNDFTLTGSDRPSDVAAARGQNDMFSGQTSAPSRVDEIRAEAFASDIRRKAADFDGTFDGRPMAPLTRDIADHALRTGKRLTDAEVEGLSAKHDIPVNVVDQMTTQPFSYDGILGQAERGVEGAKETLAAARKSGGNKPDAKEALLSREIEADARLDDARDALDDALEDGDIAAADAARQQIREARADIDAIRRERAQLSGRAPLQVDPARAAAAEQVQSVRKARREALDRGDTAEFDRLATDLRDAKAAQAEARKPSGGGAQLYSGLPLDKLAKAVADAINVQGWTKKFKEDVDLVRELIDGYKARDKNAPGPATRLVNFLGNDAHQRIQRVADARNSATAKEIADKIFATSGRGDGTQRTYWESYTSRGSEMANRVERVMTDIDASGIDMGIIRKQILNPKARQGKAGQFARDIAALLKDQLDHMRAAGVEIGDVGDGYLPRSYSAEKMAKQRAQFVKAATDMYRDMGEADPAAKAEAFWHNKVFGEDVKPGEFRPSGKENWSKERVLDERAEKYLSDFMETDLRVLLGKYMDASSRRAALAEQFGDRWADWPGMVKRMRDEGVTEDELADVANSAQAGVGMLPNDETWTRAVSSWVRTVTSLGTLPWATLTNLAEAMMPIVRSSGDVRTSFTTLKTAASDLGRFVTRMPASQRDEALRDYAEMLGAVSGAMSDATIIARFAGNDPLTAKQTKLISGFYRNIGMTQLTERNLVRAVEAGHIYMNQLAKDLGKPGVRGRNAEFELKDLGIKDPAAFAKYLDGLNGKRPDIAAGKGNPQFENYKTAVLRFTQQTVLQPNNATKPVWASRPLGAVLFQLMSFPFAFTKIVLGRAGRLAKGAVAERDPAKLALMAGMAPGMALIAAIQDMQGEARREVREAAFGKTSQQTDWARAEKALSYTGIFGKLDPVIQAMSGVRYNRTVESALLGVGAGRIANAANVTVESAFRNSDNTNTSERKSAGVVFDMLAAPMAQAFLSNAPGGVLTSAAALSVPLFREKFVTGLAGPEVERKRLPTQGFFETLVNGKAQEGRGRQQYQRESGR